MEKKYILKALTTVELGGRSLYKIIYTTPDSIYEVSNDRDYRDKVAKDLWKVLVPFWDGKKETINKIRITTDMSKEIWIATVFCTNYDSTPLIIMAGK